MIFDEPCRPFKGYPRIIRQITAFPLSTILGFESWKDRESKKDVFSIVSRNYLEIKFWKYTAPFCHWKLVIFLHGTALTGTGIFCGETLIRDIVATKEGLYFGKNVITQLLPADRTEATVLLNPRNGECVKRHYKLKLLQEEGKSKSFGAKQSITTLHEPDQECKDFLEGKLTEQQTNIDNIKSVLKQLKDNKIEVIPLLTRFRENGYDSGPQLPHKNDYVPENVYAHVSNGNDMDVLVIENKYKSRWVVLVAKGVIIDVGKILNLPTFYVSPDIIVMDSHLSLERDGKDKNLFTVLSYWNENVCTKTRYVLVKDKDGKLNRQEVFPAEIGLPSEKCIIFHVETTAINNDDGTTILEGDIESDLADYLT